MPTSIRFADGYVVTVTESDKLVAKGFSEPSEENGPFVPFTTEADGRVWVNPAYVAAIETRDDPSY